MTEREMVITALECCKDVHQSGRWSSGCISCGYSDKHRPDCFLRLADDAVELLKEQEPRVLTLDEAVDGTQVYYVEFQYHLDRGWVKCDFDRMYVDGEVAMLFLRDKTFYQQKEDYGKLWRLWNRRPTDEHMKAVKWE